MKGLKVPYGSSDFKAIRTEGYIYIDKTKYLERLEEQKYVIYVRPRRFGKSLLTSMLTNYYSIDEKEKFETLFKGLYVYENPTPNKNNYYVMNFNFSGIEADVKTDLKEIKERFDNRILFSVNQFIKKYRLDIEIKEKTGANILDELLSKFKILEKENKIYIIIDEYDHFTNGMLQGKCNNFMKILGSAGFVRAFYEVIKIYTSDGVVDRFFATGVAPVTLDSMTSGFNITVPLTTNPLFEAMCGLTDEEVKEAIKQAGIEEEKQEEIFNKMKENYDGYRISKFSNQTLFNTTLVMYYLRNYVQLGMAPEQLTDGNLATTGSKIENIAGLLNRENNYKVLEELLMNGKVKGNLVQLFELDKRFNTDDFISMLFYNGYITIKEVGIRTTFKIPNYVSQVLYADYFLKLVERRDAYKIDTNEIEEAIVLFAERGEIEKIVEKVQEFLMHCSVRDKENFNEMNLKHIFSMILALSSQYVVYGEYPAGQGFVDMLIQKSSNSLATYEGIVELKYLNKENAKKSNVKKLSVEAKNQLGKYLKDKRLEQKENLKKYVIIFKGFEEFYIEEII